MELKQIENLYLINGLGDFKLRNLGDLMKCHGVNARLVEGYSTMSDEDKKSYEKFILSMLNGCGLIYRANVIPKAIFRAYGVEYLVKDQDDDIYIIIKSEVWNKDTNKIVDSWEDEEHKHLKLRLPVEKEVLKDYLRFEYTYNFEKTWLHVVNNGEEWY